MMEASGVSSASSGCDEFAAVELRDVSLRYFSDEGETEALSNVSVSIRRGEFVSLIGQSGCGKSTLLSLIAGIIKPTDGEVLLGRAPVKGPNRKVGYMLQHDHLLEWRSVLDNALLGAEIQHLDMADARQRALRLLEKCGVGRFFNHFPRQLSGGMRQRVALVRTLCTEPDLVLLDEPFAALDSQTRLAIADETVEVLRKAGKTVILVTHDIGEAIAMTDRVIVMSRRPGRIKSEHVLTFKAPDGTRPTPYETRALPEFSKIFDRVWKEIDVHVDG